METDTMKLLILCLMFVILIFYGNVFGGGHWHKKKKSTKICDIFGFIGNILFLIGFIIGIYSPPQPMIYMIACFTVGFFVILGVICAIVCLLLVGANEIVTRHAAETTIVDGVLGLLEIFITGLIAYFSFEVWKLGG
uniref:Uncharacterized protein n=1 Tax=Panagrolaimus davidi TaxID=227884 RepID=A0A914PNZ1_9BILA